MSTSFTEFDVTPYVESSATVNEYGTVTDASIALWPFGHFEPRLRAGNPAHQPAIIMMSVEEAEAMAHRLLETVSGVRQGRYDTVDRD
ncbi:hypothetical protein OG976_03265 [Mycobacterium sp. NBC_00419]|uniref:hypothetical protein n=1 Tax=Mycobacterium sp. NBC_00419 TaxID=2975989 RepID=UPI002E1FF327